VADFTDEDGALAEIEDLDLVAAWMYSDIQAEIPRKSVLLDAESREKLPPLYRGEEKGLEALAQVKFFTRTATGAGTPASSMGRYPISGWFLGWKWSWAISRLKSWKRSEDR